MPISDDHRCRLDGGLSGPPMPAVMKADIALVVVGDAQSIRVAESIVVADPVFPSFLAV
jgi:hypothetical protein